MNHHVKQNHQFKQKGQGMVEYIIIVALIAIAAIAAYSFFGQTIRSQVAGMAQDLSGTENKGTAAAGESAAGAQKQADKDIGLGNYTDGTKTSE